MMKIELLVGADEFWRRMRRDLALSRRSAYVQTFSFEGDRVGIRMARALERARAGDRRLLIDSYSRIYHSDRIIPGPAWRDRNLRREVFLTRRWLRRLEEGGVGVRFSNPLGPSPVRLVRRSHKKVAAFDDRVVYLGGINFSDHNFAWHDMMLRVECPELAALVSEDFRASWEGRPLRYDRTVGPLRLLSMNGRGNREAFGPLIEAIDGARSSIDVVSAYLSHPFTGFLAKARERGVRVRVLMPDANNKANLARHILERAVRDGFDVVRYPGMSHMKAMRIDDELLVVGSSNFDFMSYHILEEHVVMTRDPGLNRAFTERVWEPDLRRARCAPARSSIGTRLGDLAVRTGAALAARLARPAGQLSRAACALLLLLALAGGVSAQDRPAWVVGDVPDSVWMLVEASVAESDPDEAKRILERAEAHARVAVSEDDENVGRRFALAVVLGMRTDIEGGKTKVRVASQLYEELGVVLALDPEHARAHHMMGRLHAGVRRMNRVTRWLATNLLGGEVLGEASWEEAERHLAYAEADAPEVAEHHLQLARLFADTDREELAVIEAEHVMALQARSPMALAAREEAWLLLHELGAEQARR